MIRLQPPTTTTHCIATTTADATNSGPRVAATTATISSVTAPIVAPPTAVDASAYQTTATPAASRSTSTVIAHAAIAKESRTEPVPPAIRVPPWRTSANIAHQTGAPISP